MNKKSKDYIILFIKYVILITFCLLINSLFKNYLIENFDCDISKKEFCKDENMCCSKYNFCDSNFCKIIGGWNMTYSKTSITWDVDKLNISDSIVVPNTIIAGSFSPEMNVKPCLKDCKDIKNFENFQNRWLSFGGARVGCNGSGESCSNNFKDWKTGDIVDTYNNNNFNGISFDFEGFLALGSNSKEIVNKIIEIIKKIHQIEKKKKNNNFTATIVFSLIDCEFPIHLKPFIDILNNPKNELNIKFVPMLYSNNDSYQTSGWNTQTIDKCLNNLKIINESNIILTYQSYSSARDENKKFPVLKFLLDKCYNNNYAGLLGWESENSEDDKTNMNFIIEYLKNVN